MPKFAMMNKKVSKILKFSLSVALALVLLFFAFRGVDWSAFWGGLGSCRWAWVLAGMACGLLAFLLRAFRWAILVRPLDRDAMFSTIFDAVCIGNAANCGIPGAGEFVRCGLLVSERASYDKVLGTIVVERMWDLLSLFLILVGLTFFKWDVFGTFMYERILIPASSRLNVGMGWMIGALVIMGCACLWGLVHFKDRNSLCAKVWGVVNGLWEGVRTGLRLEHAGIFILYTVFIWAAYCLQSFCFIRALPGFAELGALDAVFLMAAGSIASVVPVPGGFGAYHFIVATAIASLYALPWESGILFATLAHESQAVAMLLSGLACYIAYHIRRVEK